MPTRKQLEDLLQTDPDDVFLHYAVAKACISEGDLAAGLERFDEVLRRDPDYVPAYFQKGQALAEDDQADAARAVIEQGIAVARRVDDQHALQEMTGFLEML